MISVAVFSPDGRSAERERRTMRTIAAVAALAASALAQPSPQPAPALQCVYSLPSNIGTASWDLTGLATESGVKIIDSRDNTDSPYDYYVRVCNDMREWRRHARGSRTRPDPALCAELQPPWHRNTRPPPRLTCSRDSCTPAPPMQRHQRPAATSPAARTAS